MNNRAGLLGLFGLLATVACGPTSDFPSNSDDKADAGASSGGEDSGGNGSPGGMDAGPLDAASPPDTDGGGVPRDGAVDGGVPDGGDAGDGAADAAPDGSGPTADANSAPRRL